MVKANAPPATASANTPTVRIQRSLIAVPLDPNDHGSGRQQTGTRGSHFLRVVSAAVSRTNGEGRSGAGPNASVDDPCVRAGRLLRDAGRVVVLTGAGISTESGIPDFRSPGGLWSRYDPTSLTFDRFLASE